MSGGDADIPPALVRRFDAPDERLDLAGVIRDVLDLDGTTLTRSVYPTGWQHTVDFGPDLCAVEHVGYCLGGRMRVWWEDGREVVVEAGSAFVLPPGHDSLVEEACTLLQVVR